MIRSAVGLILAALLSGTGAEAQSPRQQDVDARIKYNVGFRVEPDAAQKSAEQAMLSAIPDLAVTYDSLSGVASRLRSHSGFLTAGTGAFAPAAEPKTLALDFVDQNRALFGLSLADLADFEVTDQVLSTASGTTHLYLRQRFAGIPVYNGQLQVNVDRAGRVKSVNNAWVRDLASSVNSSQPDLDAAGAVIAAAQHLDVTVGHPTLVATEPGAQQTTVLSLPELSNQEITAALFWLPIRLGDTRLVWNFQVFLPDGLQVYDLNIDAVSGQVWTRFSWVDQATYRVYERPVESPIHTLPLPPADARTLVVDPESPEFSPLGWHNPGTGERAIMRGNNVHAFEDRDGNRLPPAVEPACVGFPQVCDFPLDLTVDPFFSIPAAVTNLFYWNNIVHDTQALYGFDEAAGNFQEMNFGRFGVGRDSVRAHAQSTVATGNCNAFFRTLPDGLNPTMQVFLCDRAFPPRDGDFDNLVIVHEYGHGITSRQVGGPSNVRCLRNRQRPSEGWSDWLGLVYTAESEHLATDPRTIAGYFFNYPPGVGLRPLPYSVDPAINDHTYESISGLGIPHGVGAVWAQALWKVYWGLIADHGFDRDLTNFDPRDLTAAAGNQRALLYVNEGLKNTACDPTFVDARDGIIQAVLDFDSDDLCPVWKQFADFGLGADAGDCGPDCNAVTNGFRLPVACDPDFAGPDDEICLGESVIIGQRALPGTTYLWEPGGETTPQITVSPTFTTTYTVTARDAFGTYVDSVTVTVEPDCRCGLNERFENDVSSWTATGLWHRTDDSLCASPEPGYGSATHAFYYGQDATCDFHTGDLPNAGTLTSPPILGINTNSVLTFRYLREVESFPGPFDRTEVDIVTEDGSTTVFALDSLDPSTAVWTSSDSISLADFAGEKIRVRFRFETGDEQFNNFIGWFIDDVMVNSANTTDVDFNRGPSGWTNNAVLSTCTTGSFVTTVPQMMISFDTVTQPDGDCTTGGGNAFYTAVNSSASIHDVDLGMCVADSPVYPVSEKSLVSTCFFHGQRTGGDDPGGDFFRLEISTDGGLSYAPIEELGDDRMEAVWRSRGIAVDGTGDVRLRVTVSDAAGPSDVIEGGVDDIRICPFDGTP